MRTSPNNISLSINRRSRTFFHAAALVLCAFLLSGCSLFDTEDAQQPTQPGLYVFTAYDSSGTAILEGTMNLHFPDESGWDVEGEWAFENIGEIDQRVERMIGEGQLHGSVRDDGNVRISLRPDIEDADARLQGTFEMERKLQGTWAIVDWGVPSRSGRFEAILQ
jgi:hypothetical protein